MSKRTRIIISLVILIILASWAGYDITGLGLERLLLLMVAGFFGYRIFVRGRLYLGAYSATNKAFRNRDFAKAVEICDQRIRRAPNDVNALLTGASAKMNLDEPEDALEYCDRALKVDGKNVITWATRSHVLLQLGRNKEALHDSLHAAASAKHQKWVSPGSGVFAVRAYAHACIRNCQYEQALEEAEFLRSHGRSEEALYIRANALHNMNDFESAIETCDTALAKLRGGELRPYILNIRGCALINLGKYDEALKQFDDAIVDHPKVAMLLVNRANCLTHLKEFERAQTDLSAAENMRLSRPVHAVLLNTKSRMLLLKGEFDEALSAANEALSIHAVPSVYCSMAAVLLRSGKPGEAKEQSSKAIEMDNYESEAYWLRAESLTALGETDRAAADRAVAQKYRYIPYL